jgi:uncharacterized protein (TIGR02001 family)
LTREFTDTVGGFIDLQDSVGAANRVGSSTFSRRISHIAFMALALYLHLSESSFAADTTPETVKADVADPSPFSVGYGVKFTSDYMFRGATQSDGKPAVQGYVEGRLFDWFYAGFFISSVSFPANPWGLSDPAAELDYFVGARHTWDRFTLDVGAMYFTYPGQIAVGDLGGGLPATDLNMWEVAVKPSFAFNDSVTVGGSLGYSPDYVGTGAYETYLSGNIRVNLPPLVEVEGANWFASGEVGHQWIGTTDLKSSFIPDANVLDFTNWNAGIGVTYKSATLDFRYFGSTLKNGVGGSCFSVTSMTNACGDRFAVTLSFDM